MITIQKLQAEIAQSQQTLDKLVAQDSKLDSNLKELKEAMASKKLAKQANNPKQSMTQIDQEKIEKQLEKELENAKAKLKQYHNELKTEAKRAASKTNANTLEELFSLEEVVKQKDQQIKQLNDQIKQLANLKRKQEKLLESKDKQSEEGGGGKVAKLADEIRGLKQMLSTLQGNSTKKKEALTKKHKQIEELEQKYRAVCDQNGQKPITFEQFKQQRKERKNAHEDSSLRKQPKKQYMSIKQIISAKDNYESLEPTQENLERLKEKRDIAEAALKNAKRKNEKEIEELTKKLQYLQEENAILENRLKEKEKEKQIVETRFSDAKKPNVRKLTPLK